MLPLKNRIHHPIFVVPLSLFLSVSGYVISDFFAHWQKFWLGMYLAVLLPIIISLPLALIMDRYFKKFQSQKKELEHLDTINKKLFLLISHDVRSPLASLIGTIDLVTDNDLDPQEAKLYFSELSRKIKNVNSFLDGLLNWARRQTQNKPLEFSLYDSSDIIKLTHDLLEPAAKLKKIRITTKLGHHKIYADKESYSFVLRNILHNAIKFTPIDGEITIETFVKNKQIYTTIQDSGIGITKNEIKKILDGENWHTTKGTSNENGSGFGLRTCLYYLKQNNGVLLIDSEIDTGTKITIVLPAEK
ncbi:sensor histidine kinase [Cellulophaga baltica]|uniref:histidine kinase n=1 Tax=Cellulophaga baltica TaxID=76594 RepID=A0A1G7D7P2_9FLAO|nr:HAMP domain-containing sensor histidine kinase [Cellulophaga baltica]SDE47658.1 Signal transduction histidine kinase [Cellulophaga baltica]